MFNKLKEKWIKDREDSLKEEYKDRIESLYLSLNEREKSANDRIIELEKSLEMRKAQLELDNEIIQRRRIELANESDILREQLKILEAKSHPSSVWTEAFSMGFSKAWDMMIPIMTEGVHKLKKQIEDQAIDETILRMNDNKKY